jgi:LPXTG-site transpeptidase (sortase) family protein
MNKTSKNSIFGSTLRKGLYFSLIFIPLFIATFSTLYILGLVPESLIVEKSDNSEILEQNDGLIDRTPERIVIEHLGIDSNVRNPLQDDITILDAELKKGVVRYPGSGIAGQGSMFLFGHSANVPVQNKAYEALNNLQDLDKGDEIKIYTKSGIFIYKVDNVSLIEADKAFVDIASNKNMLTLSTCNTFGKKEERYVVEAEYVGFVESKGDAYSQ